VPSSLVPHLIETSVLLDIDAPCSTSRATPRRSLGPPGLAKPCTACIRGHRARWRWSSGRSLNDSMLIFAPDHFSVRRSAAMGADMRIEADSEFGWQAPRAADCHKEFQIGALAAIGAAHSNTAGRQGYSLARCLSPRATPRRLSKRRSSV